MTPFGVKLGELRQLRRMPHDDLARQLKMNAAELTSWQAGLNGTPSLVLLFQIERVLKLTPFEVAELKNAARLSAPEVVVRTQGLSVAAIELLYVFAERVGRLPDKTIAAIRKLLDK